MARAIQRKRLASLGASLYDATKGGDSQRSNFWMAFPLTGEKEMSSFTRRQSLRKLRAVEANCGVIQAIKEKTGRYAVGRGLFPIPQTKDEPWNISMAARFDEWASNPGVCDATGLMNYWEIQKWNAETYPAEGEAFNGLVRTSKNNSPQIQIFDNGEVEYLPGTGSVPGFAGADKYVYWDGVKLDRKGRIQAYVIRTMDGGGYEEVEAVDMIHIAKRKRPNQMRGVSPFAPELNSSVDWMDLKGLETATRKLHSFLAMYITKVEGSGIGTQGLTGSLRDLLSPAVTAAGLEKQVAIRNAIGEEIVSGGGIAHLGQGEEIKMLTSTREVSSTIDFMILLFRALSTSYGLPIEVIWDMMQLGGAPARIVLTDAQWFFDSVQDKINDNLNYRVWVWWLSCMFDQGYPFPNDPIWWRVEWMGPPKLTADAGKAMIAEIAALNAGFGTWQDYYEARGKNWRPRITQRVQEVKFAKAECARLGLEYAEVFPPPAGSAPSMGGGNSGGVGSGADPGGGVQG